MNLYAFVSKYRNELIIYSSIYLVIFYMIDLLIHYNSMDITLVFFIYIFGFLFGWFRFVIMRTMLRITNVDRSKGETFFIFISLILFFSLTLLQLILKNGGEIVFFIPGIILLPKITNIDNNRI